MIMMMATRDALRPSSQGLAHAVRMHHRHRHRAGQGGERPRKKDQRHQFGDHAMHSIERRRRDPNFTPAAGGTSAAGPDANPSKTAASSIGQFGAQHNPM